MSESIVKDFVTAYTREFDFYQAAARSCSEKCEALLAERGVRAILSHRAKRPAKLFAKLNQRNPKEGYKTGEQIREDIPDLAGVRIALYFPGDRDRVKSIIRDNFDVKTEKNFPKDGKKRLEKRFEGYCADHYRVQIRDSGLDESTKQYAAAKIEIQVGSVLMHGWAEVEHDLIYKPESGNLSEDEHAILDELNGMVIAGEIALERLQRAVERRLSQEDVVFDSHYELAAYLHKWLRNSSFISESSLGRVDVLWELLRKADLNTATRLTELLGSPSELTVDDPISDQIADLVLAKNPGLYNTYVNLQASLTTAKMYDQVNSSTSDRMAAIGEFLTSWIVLECTFMLLNNRPTSGILRSFNNLPKIGQELGLSREAVSAIARIRSVRNQLIHGIEVPSRSYLNEVTSELKEVLKEIKDHSNEAVKSAYKEARRRLHS